MSRTVYAVLYIGGALLRNANFGVLSQSRFRVPSPAIFAIIRINEALDTRASKASLRCLMGYLREGACEKLPKTFVQNVGIFNITIIISDVCLLL